MPDTRPVQCPQLTDTDIADNRQRLIAAGLTDKAADIVARHPSGGPVVLAPGVIISLFARDNAAGTSQAVAS